MLTPLPDPPPWDGRIEDATEGVRKLSCVVEERKLAIEPFTSQCTSTSVEQAGDDLLPKKAVQKISLEPPITRAEKELLMIKTPQSEAI